MSAAHRRRGSRPHRTHAAQAPRTPPPGALTQVRRAADGDAWEFVPPRCAQERQEDLEEVAQMLTAGEQEVALDELRWLLEDCRDFLAAHRLLGELHLTNDDLPLARAHFGYAYQIGLDAIARTVCPAAPRVSAAQADAILALPGPLPYERPANQPFFEAAKGLVWCLGELKLADRAVAVCRQTLTLDRTDPLGFAALERRLTAPPEEA